MVQFVTVTVDTTGLSAPLSRSFGDVGLVGYGITGTDNVVQSYVQLSSIVTDYGQASAIAQSAALIMANGVNKVYVVKATGTPATQEVFSGDATTTVFTLTDYPQQGSVVVEVAAVAQVEGTDFYVDYGNKTITFYTAPATGASNITVDYDTITSADFATALVELERKVANIVVGAMIFEPALLSALETHVTNASSSGLERIGVAMLPNGNATGTVDAVVLATSLVSERMVVIAHKTLYDAASAVAGAIGKHQPQESMIMKPILNIAGSDVFTPTEEDALLALQINPLVDPALISGSGLYMGDGLNLSSDATRKYIDIVRVADDLSFRMKASLILVIGDLKITRAGIASLRSRMRAVLNERLQAGVIESFDVVIPIEALLAIDPSKRTSDEIIQIDNVKNSREILDMEAIFTYAGAMHKLAVVLKFQ